MIYIPSKQLVATFTRIQLNFLYPGEWEEKKKVWFIPSFVLIISHQFLYKLYLDLPFHRTFGNNYRFFKCVHDRQGRPIPYFKQQLVKLGRDLISKDLFFLHDIWFKIIRSYKVKVPLFSQVFPSIPGNYFSATFYIFWIYKGTFWIYSELE